MKENITLTEVIALMDRLNQHIREKAVLENDYRTANLAWERMLNATAKEEAKDRLLEMVNRLGMLSATLHCEEHEFDLAKIVFAQAQARTTIQVTMQEAMAAEGKS